MIKNIRNKIKHFLKTSPFIMRLFVNVIFGYLKFVYFTSKWYFIWPNEISEKEINKEQGLLLAIWHNRLAFAMYMYKNLQNVYGLASPHSDGQLIITLIKKMNYKVIAGSTNRNAIAAVKEIIKLINQGNKVVITPDGPRGPIYKINSNITRIANKYRKKIIPTSCIGSKYFTLNSWDKMIIPKPFGKIIVVIGTPLQLCNNEDIDNKLLETTLIDLDNKAKEFLKHN